MLPLFGWRDDVVPCYPIHVGALSVLEHMRWLRLKMVWDWTTLNCATTSLVDTLREIRAELSGNSTTEEEKIAVDIVDAEGAGNNWWAGTTCNITPKTDCYSWMLRGGHGDGEYRHWS